MPCCRLRVVVNRRKEISEKVVNKFVKMPDLPMDDFVELMGMIDSDFDISDEENSEEEERQVEQRNAGIIRMREFYERRIDILDYFDDEKIRKTFRFDRVSINYITELVADRLPRRTSLCRRRLLPLHQVLAALQFYATGTFQAVCGNVLRMSQPSICRSIHAVSKALCELSSQFIYFPQNLLELKRRFLDLAGMPGTVGAIDCTHVRIVKPSADEYAYVNRKGYHSINVQAIVDADYRYLNVISNKPGSVNDSTIFKESRIGAAFKNREFGESYLIGDSGYANTPFLLTPYAHPSTLEQERFNDAHMQTRTRVEQTYGITKRRFPGLHLELRLTPGKASRVIMACAVLHNIARARRLEEFEDEENEDEYEVRRRRIPDFRNDDDDDNRAPLHGEEARLRREGNALRDRIARLHFSR